MIGRVWNRDESFRLCLASSFRIDIFIWFWGRRWLLKERCWRRWNAGIPFDPNFGETRSSEEQLTETMTTIQPPNAKHRNGTENNTKFEEQSQR